MDVHSFEEVIEELCCGYEIWSSHWVHVTHVTNPHNFHVRPCKYDSHLEHLESFIQTNEESIDPSIHQLVAFRSITQEGKIIRGQIISITETELSKTCEIFTLDYGFVDKAIPMKHIYKCEDIFFQIPPLALNCQLYMCSPVGREWSDDSVEAFRYYLGEERAKMIVKHRIHNKFIVELINTCPDDITTMLAMTGYSTLGYVEPMISRLPSTSSSSGLATKKLYFNFRARQLNDTLCVRMLYGQKLNEFYVAEVSEYKDFLKLTDDINFHALRGRELQVSEMIIGGPVLINEKQHLRCSQRAVIESLCPSTSEANVCYIDNGKRVLTKTFNIKYIPQELLIHPGVAIYCRAQDIPSSIKLEDFFLPGFEFYITIEEVGSELKFPNIVKISVT